MTPLTIQLDDAVYAALVAQAKSRRMDVAELAAEKLAVDAAAPQAAVSPDVAEIIAKQIEYYRPVFRRLAE